MGYKDDIIENFKGTNSRIFTKLSTRNEESNEETK